jgi:hypothetical protein
METVRTVLWLLFDVCSFSVDTWVHVDREEPKGSRLEGEYAGCLVLPLQPAVRHGRDGAVRTGRYLALLGCPP